MKSHPLIFQAWGIRAIRNIVPGSWPAVAVDPSQPIKWMTRRVMKPQLLDADEECMWCHGKGHEYIDCMNELSGYDYRRPCRCRIPQCPYAVGDQIWTRESCYQSPLTGEILYRADMQWGTCTGHAAGVKWKPSIHMHRVDSRDNLLIHNIRVERVQDISAKDAEAEGLSVVQHMPLIPPPSIDIHKLANAIAKNMFNKIWDTLHAKPKLYRSDIMRLGVETPYYVSFPWSKSTRDPRTEINRKPHYCFPNPYVWVYEIGRL